MTGSGRQPAVSPSEPWLHVANYEMQRKCQAGHAEVMTRERMETRNMIPSANLHPGGCSRTLIANYLSNDSKKVLAHDLLNVFL